MTIPKSSLAALACLLACFVTGCTTLHLPNTAFEDPSVLPLRKFEFTSHVGNIQALEFSDFEKSADKSTVNYKNLLSFPLGFAAGLSHRLEVSVSSYSEVPLPGLIGFKYQFLGAGDAPEPVTAAVVFKYAYFVFSNSTARAGTISGSCAGSQSCGTADENGLWVNGDLNTEILALPIGYTMNDRFRLAIVPQLTYFDGKYTRVEKISSSEERETPFGLSGWRKTLAINLGMALGRSWELQASTQFHDYSWNGINSSQHFSAYFGASYVIGGR